MRFLLKSCRVCICVNNTARGPRSAPCLRKSFGKAFARHGALWTTAADGKVKIRLGPSCAQPPLTVHQMFKETVDKYGALNALASKKDGTWEKITFSEYYQMSWQAAKSFLHLGLQRFHSVGILGFNSSEWFISAVGAIFAGGITTGIYSTNSPEACYYVADNSRANIIMVENQKQLDKIMQIWDKLPHLKAVVQYKGSVTEKHPNLYTWEEFMDLGGNIPDSKLEDIIISQKPNECCVLIYTSGTTGEPKGVMLSHDNITWTAAHASRAGNMMPAEIQQETIVSYLPLSHIAAQIKELIITAGGENVPPVPIEDAVKKELPVISNAMLIGDKRKFLTMLLTLKSILDPETSEPTDCLTPEAVQFCLDVGSKATKVSEIVEQRDRAIYQAIQDGINRVNAQATSNAQRIQKWTVLAKDFSISGGELGPTMKLRRPAVLEKYKEEIALFYEA